MEINPLEVNSPWMLFQKLTVNSRKWAFLAVQDSLSKLHICMELVLQNSHQDIAIFWMQFFRKSLMQCPCENISVCFCNIAVVSRILCKKPMSIKLQALVHDVNVLLKGVVVSLSRCSKFMAMLIRNSVIKSRLGRPSFNYVIG